MEERSTVVCGRIHWWGRRLSPFLKDWVDEMSLEFSKKKIKREQNAVWEKIQGEYLENM